MVASKLARIDHIVVLMLENRSFDHMLGYLSLEGNRTDVDGLRTNLRPNRFAEEKYPVFHLPSTYFHHDPGHSSDDVNEQLSARNGGFVSNFDGRLAKKKAPRDYRKFVMGYYNANDVPVFDHLATQFVVCDRWFSSVPGPTVPNRLFALAGNSNGETTQPSGRRIVTKPYPMKTIFEYLDEAPRSRRGRKPWCNFYHDMPSILYFGKYRIKAAWSALFGSSRISRIERFYEMVQKGELPDVSWIDPDFGEFGRHNDDHPPVDVRDGQRLVGEIYNALLKGGNDLWTRVLFIVTYDEHGGFYDHVKPPEANDDRPDIFPRLGLRVPALIVSPWVARGRRIRKRFDHTSILKTILVRFCQRDDGTIPTMGLRVDSANDLGSVLSEPAPRDDATESPPVPIVELDALTPSTELNDLQDLHLALKQEMAAAGIDL